MHLLAQGWKRQVDGTMRVSAIALSPCTNGMVGWQLHIGCYDPNCGQTIQQANWKFKLAAGSLYACIDPHVASEMATWGDDQSSDLLACLKRTETFMRDIAEKLH